MPNCNLKSLIITPFYFKEGEKTPFNFKVNDIFGNLHISDKLLKIERITLKYIILNEYKEDTVFRMSIDDFIKSFRIGGCTMRFICEDHEFEDDGCEEMPLILGEKN